MRSTVALNLINFTTKPEDISVLKLQHHDATVEEPPDWPKQPPVKEPGQPHEKPPPPGQPPIEEPRDVPPEPPVKEPPPKDPGRTPSDALERHTVGSRAF